MVAVLLTAVSAGYVARHFAIDTDVSKLISAELPWRQRELSYNAAFPQRDGTILTVIDARTPELADEAANKLAQRLTGQPALFTSVRQPGGGAFFQQNGLLFQSPEEVAKTTNQLMTATPLLGTLAADPSFRGVMDGLAIGVGGVQAGQMKLDDLARPMTRCSPIRWMIIWQGAPQAFPGACS